MTAADWLYLAGLALVALVIGSFVGALVVRLPMGVGIAVGRSRCPSCGHQLAPADLVPLASYLWRRGRCRYCLARIGIFYPAVELASLAIALWAATLTQGPLLWASCVLGWTLLALGLIDWREHILPDALTLPLLLVGLAVAWFLERNALVDRLLGAALGYAIFALIAWGYWRWRGREGLGMGDAKLLAALGAWVGGSGLPGVVLIAAVVALAVALFRALRGGLDLGERIPFGPYLAAAGWLIWLYGPLP
jgi:leader peptidase (prepilin peptidase)/N-methyltransferase